MSHCFCFTICHARSPTLANKLCKTSLPHGHLILLFSYKPYISHQNHKAMICIFGIYFLEHYLMTNSYLHHTQNYINLYWTNYRKNPGRLSYICSPDLCVAKCSMKILLSVSLDCRIYNSVHILVLYKPQYLAYLHNVLWTKFCFWLYVFLSCTKKIQWNKNKTQSLQYLRISVKCFLGRSETNS